MASKADGQQLQALVCPLCLDVSKNPTLLSCAHTFCRECLEAYDEQHRLDHIVCPVCRESTNLGQNRVEGLKPNFIVRDIQDKLNVVAPSQSLCPLHKKTHNDIFCEDCKEFICFTCFIDSHKDHKIKKKEELEGDLRKKRDSLIRESEMRKAQIEESVNNAEQHMQSHFSNVEKEIKDAFARGVTVLQQKEESLLNDLDSIRKGHKNQLEGCVANIRQAIADINTSIVTLKDTGKAIDLDTIKAQYLQCSELEKALKRSTDDGPIVRLKQTAESTWFQPSDEKLLALGHIKEMNNIQQAKTTTGTKRKSAQPSGSGKNIPPPLRNKSLNIVSQVDTQEWISGMVAAQFMDAVVVGYGLSIPGSDRFSVSGGRTRHLMREVGRVHDIAILTDGRSVVSKDKDALRVYSTRRHSTFMQYTCKAGEYYIKLCIDHDDNIYAVNGNPEIYIFHGSNPNPQRVIPAGDIEPEEIYVTKTGALITRSWDTDDLNTVTVFDREGHVGSSITASDGDEYLYATVDSEDRVLVARMWRRSGVFRLTRYTLQGTTLIKQVIFNELKLPHDNGHGYPHSRMTSIHPNLIAFADLEHMYFIELAE